MPIISSKRDFNEGLLDDTNSILVNPESIDEIADAIKKLKNDNVLRDRLRQGALKKATELTIRQRAINIMHILEKIVNEKE